MTSDNNALIWSNKLLDHLLQRRRQLNGFRFWLRQRDRGDRLTNGYWFQGNDTYIFLSFWARSGGSNMTRSLGWIVGINDDGSTPTHMEVVYNGETDKEIIKLYHQIITTFQMEKQTETKYRLKFIEKDPMKSLDHFLTKIKPQIDDMIRKSGKEELFITDEKFKEMLDNTLALRNSGSPSKQQTENASLENNTHMETALNQIFFGPPGTGKTYHTINAAVQVCDPDFYYKNQNNRAALRKRFQELLIDWKQSVISGQVAFCTFHQSFSYEDFVEGIKPQKPADGDQYLKYKVEAGIFKKICTLAADNLKASNLKNERVISMNEETFKKAVFYKISLGNINKDEDLAIYEYCIKNNCIALGYGGDFDFSGLDEEQIVKKCKALERESFTEQAVNRFIHYIKAGNYILVSSGNHYVRAIGKVTGNYFFDPNTAIKFKHFRSVEWLVRDENIPIAEIYDRALSQQTIYKLDEDGIKKEFFVNTGKQNQQETKEIKDFVLIIDEINRGNVSSIFGELITLIEKDKRAGGSEELEVVLPYSKEVFKVPSNVHIIGTMNTADRSIEALDTALRRRFSFKEMPPQSHLLTPQHRVWDLFWKYIHVDWHEEPYKSKEDVLFAFIGAPAKLQSRKKEIWARMLEEKEPGLHQVEWLADFDYTGLRLDHLLTRINDRIEKLIDKDHRIGHSYFLGITSIEELREAFRDKVIPLLQEYFFGDYSKIGLVLGNAFVSKSKDGFNFAPFDGIADGSYVQDLSEKIVYEIKLKDWSEADFRSIYA